MDWLGPASDPLKAERLEEHKNHYLAFKRVPVRTLVKFDDDGNVVESPRNVLPLKYLEELQRNQKLPICCRHPENHDLVSLFSSNADKAKGVPDIYIFICKERHDLGKGRIGEAHHRRFCVGGGTRPGWEVR